MLALEKNVIPIIEAIYDDLTTMEKAIADYFLLLDRQGQGQMPDLSAHAVADRLFVSLPSLTRFAKKCGYSGYRQFIYDFNANALGHAEVHNSLTKSVLYNYEELLNKTYALIDEAQAVRVCELLNNAKRVYIYGQGSSGLAALEMKFRFMRLGMICEAITDLHTIMMNSVLLDGDCLVIGMSVSANPSIVGAVRDAKEMGAKTVLITSKKNEQLSETCDELVLIAMKNTLEQGKLISPQFPILLIIDMFYSYYKELDKDKKNKYFSHTLDVLEKNSGRGE